MTIIRKVDVTFGDFKDVVITPIKFVTYRPENWTKSDYDMWDSYTLLHKDDPDFTDLGTPYFRFIGEPTVFSGRELTYLSFRMYVNEPGWRQVERVPFATYKLRKIDLNHYLALPPKPVFYPKLFRLLEPKLDLSFKPYRPKSPITRSPRVYSNWETNHLPKLLAHRSAFESDVILRRTKIHRRKMSNWKERKQKFEQTEQARLLRFTEATRKWLIRSTLIQKRILAVKSWKRTGSFKKTITYGKKSLVDHPYLSVTIVPVKGENPLTFSNSNDAARGSDAMQSHLGNWWTESYRPYFSTSTRVECDKNVYSVALSTSAFLQNILQPEIKSLDVKIIGKLYQKILRQKIHVGNFLAERAQAYDLLFNSTKRLVELIGAKKHIFRHALSYIKSPKNLANDYLALKFGVEPLFSDIEGAIEYLTSSDDSMNIVVRSKSSIPVSKTTGNGVITGLLTTSYVLKYAVDSKVAHDLASLGLVNPAEIVWETTPWSFIIDWFLPIGNYIQALNADVGLRFVSGTKSINFVGRVDTNPTNLPFNPGLGMNLSLPSPSDYGGFLSSLSEVSSVYSVPFGKFDVKFRKRSVLSEPPDRFVILLKNPLSITHGLLSLSLLIQKICKK